MIDWLIDWLTDWLIDWLKWKPLSMMTPEKRIQYNVHKDIIENCRDKSNYFVYKSGYKVVSAGVWEPN